MMCGKTDKLSSRRHEQDIVSSSVSCEIFRRKGNNLFYFKPYSQPLKVLGFSQHRQPEASRANSVFRAHLCLFCPESFSLWVSWQNLVISSSPALKASWYVDTVDRCTLIKLSNGSYFLEVHKTYNTILKQFQISYPCSMQQLDLFTLSVL